MWIGKLYPLEPNLTKHRIHLLETDKFIIFDLILVVEIDFIYRL